MPRALQEVVFVDGVRTPFGRAGEKGMYWNTRADDLVVKAIHRSCCERNPELPKDRIDDVAIAATTQTGDQGLTLGRTRRCSPACRRPCPGYAIDRMCAGAMTERHDDGRLDRLRRDTTSPSPAASSTWAATRWATAPTRTRASSPSAWSTESP